MVQMMVLVSETVVNYYRGILIVCYSNLYLKDKFDKDAWISNAKIIDKLLLD